MSDQNRKMDRINRILIIPFSLLQLTLIVANGLTEDWIKITDPIANWIYFHIFIPSSGAITILAIFLVIKKSEKSFFSVLRFALNGLMIVIIVFFSTLLIDNF